MSSEKGRNQPGNLECDRFVACTDLYLSFGSHFLINKWGKKSTGAELEACALTAPRLYFLEPSAK